MSRERKGGEGELTSMACSAFVSWTTPTTALAIRMRRITAGSTKAAKGLASAECSKRARRKEMAADARRMRTRRSLNWSRTSCQRGVGGSTGSSVGCVNGGRKEEEEEEEGAYHFCRRARRDWQPCLWRGRRGGRRQSVRGFGGVRASTARGWSWQSVRACKTTLFFFFWRADPAHTRQLRAGDVAMYQTRTNTMRRRRRRQQRPRRRRRHRARGPSPPAMGNTGSSSGRPHHDDTVDYGFLSPHGVYTGPRDWNHSIVTQLIVDRKLAPFYRPLEDYNADWDDDQILTARKDLPDSDSTVPDPLTTRPDPRDTAKPAPPSKRASSLPSRCPEAALYRGAIECPICFLVRYLLISPTTH